MQLVKRHVSGRVYIPIFCTFEREAKDGLRALLTQRKQPAHAKAADHARTHAQPLRF